MNQHRNAEDWDRVAKEFRCENMKELLYKYYVTQHMTTREIATALLDISKDRVVQLLKVNGIPLRRRGGAH